MLILDLLHFADPEKFNDPLDTKPCVNPDLSNTELEGVLRQMVKHREIAELKNLSGRIKHSDEYIQNTADARADNTIIECQYQATNPDYGNEADALKEILTSKIENELLRRFDRGIVSLAERDTCPLMWSHYADQHRGICIGYSIPIDVAPSLHKMCYGGSRRVKASAIAAMLSGDSVAERIVDKAVLAQEAKGWRYEREWRLIGDRGTNRSPIELEEIIFGLRCVIGLKFAIISALRKRRRPVKFFEIREVPGQFRLRKHAVDADELCAFFPARARDAIDDFQGLQAIDS